jgi:hypothetical protein
MPRVAHQIATAIVQTSGATTEIALNPEELGRAVHFGNGW